MKVIKILDHMDRNEIIKWLNSEVGVMNWNWAHSDYGVVHYWNTIKFKKEEDRVKFILRWL